MSVSLQKSKKINRLVSSKKDQSPSNPISLYTIKKIMIINDVYLSQIIKNRIQVISTSKIRRYRHINHSSFNLFDQTFKECEINLCLDKSYNITTEYKEVHTIFEPIISNVMFSDKTVDVSQKTLKPIIKICASEVASSNPFDRNYSTEEMISFAPDTRSSFPQFHVNESLESVTERLSSKTKTLKKLVSLFSTKRNPLVNDVKSQVINILDPEKNITRRERFKSLNILLMDKELESILDQDDMTESGDYSSSMISETIYDTEDVDTQLSLEYTNYFINKTNEAKKRTNSGTFMISESRFPSFKATFGCVDGCIDFRQEANILLNEIGLSNDRESFNALSHMYTLKKLLGLDHAYGQNVSKPKSFSGNDTEEDSSSSSDENEDSVDFTLINVFCQKIMKEITMKHVMKSTYKRYIHSTVKK